MEPRAAYEAGDAVLIVRGALCPSGAYEVVVEACGVIRAVLGRPGLSQRFLVRLRGGRTLLCLPRQLARVVEGE